MATPTQVVQYQTGFSDDLRLPAEALLGQAKTLAAQPYVSYADYAKQMGLSGDQVAQFSDLQNKTFENAANLGQNQFSTAAATGLQNLAGQQFGQAQADQYMNPYMQSVVQNQQRDAARQSAIQGTQQQAQATQSGAFGGSRDAIMRAERERNLLLQQGDIQAAGLQNAYTNAQNQFNADTNRGMQGYANLGSQGQNLYGQTLGNLDVQNKLGSYQQQAGQNAINVNQANFREQQAYPYKQVGFMSDIVRGLPVSQTSSTMFNAPPSMISQLGGLGVAAKYSGLFDKAKGGVIRAGLADLALSRM